MPSKSESSHLSPLDALQWARTALQLHWQRTCACKGACTHTHPGGDTSEGPERTALGIRGRVVISANRVFQTGLWDTVAASCHNKVPQKANGPVTHASRPARHAQRNLVSGNRGRRADVQSEGRGSAPGLPCCPVTRLLQWPGKAKYSSLGLSFPTCEMGVSMKRSRILSRFQTVGKLSTTAVSTGRAPGGKRGPRVQKRLQRLPSTEFRHGVSEGTQTAVQSG